MSDDKPDFFFVLHDLARQMRALANRRAGLHGMTRAQWVMLIWLERQPGLSQKELSELIEVEPITVARIVDRLEANGMVERRADPADRRIWRLHLCPPSRSILSEMRHERADMYEIATAGLGEDEIQAVTAALCRIKSNVVAELRARPVEKEIA